MKLFAALLTAGLLAGCTTVQKEWTCEKAKAAYEAYRTAQDAGLVTDPQVVASAKVASAFLSAYCGWYAPRTRGLVGAPLTDTNGVQIVYYPK